MKRCKAVWPASMRSEAHTCLPDFYYVIFSLIFRIIGFFVFGIYVAVCRFFELKPKPSSGKPMLPRLPLPQCGNCIFYRILFQIIHIQLNSRGALNIFTHIEILVCVCVCVFSYWHGSALVCMIWPA